MSSRSVVYLSLIIIFSINVNSIDFCGKRRHFNEPKGLIETNEESAHFANCTWSIKTPIHSVVYIKIEHLQLGRNIGHNVSETNCFYVRSSNQELTFFNVCSDIDTFVALSIPANDLRINLEINSESYLELTYASYIVNCTYDQLLCITSRVIEREPAEICLRGLLTCDSSCRKSEDAICGDLCYDIFKQRCDGVLNCPNAEDELGCNPTLCPNKILCSNDTKCVEPKQICDKIIDCKSGYDESHCPLLFCEGGGASCYMEKRLENDLGKDDSIYVIIIILGVLTILFLCVLFRCLAARQNVRVLLNRPLDIPLPPFRGPGEGSSTVEIHPFSDEDFQPGGEIYEGFIQNLKKIKSKRKNLLEIEEGGITFVKPPPEHEVLNKYFSGVKPVLSEELAALATLKISRDMCHGLRKTRSEERPMTKLLFIDNFDNDGSGDSDTKGNEGPSYSRKDMRRHYYPKSDTESLRRKRVEVTIV